MKYLTYIIPEDESDKSQDDDNISFQPPDQFKVATVQKHVTLQNTHRRYTTNSSGYLTAPVNSPDSGEFTVL